YRVRRASWLAGEPAQHQRSRAVPAAVQVEPRCGANVVRGAAGGCRDARRVTQSCRAGKAKRAHYAKASSEGGGHGANADPAKSHSIPCDDLALAAEVIRSIEQCADPAAHQKSRPAEADRVAAAAPGCGLAPLVLQLRQREQLAPHLPGLGDFLGIGAD